MFTLFTEMQYRMIALFAHAAAKGLMIPFLDANRMGGVVLPTIRIVEIDTRQYDHSFVLC